MALAATAGARKARPREPPAPRSFTQTARQYYQLPASPERGNLRAKPLTPTPMGPEPRAGFYVTIVPLNYIDVDPLSHTFRNPYIFAPKEDVSLCQLLLD